MKRRGLAFHICWPVLACLLCTVGAWALPGDGHEISYDTTSKQWRFDPEKIVSRNDVLLDAPTSKPFQAMPVGGGDVSAMVRCDGDLHVHLSKSDLWTSPGHVRLDLGAKGKELAAKHFSQRLDLYHGRVVIQLGNAETGVRLEVWGHPSRRLIIVDVFDPQQMLGPASVELSEWRKEMTVGRADATLWAKEVCATPIRPRLATTGMQDFFTDETDPLLGRGIGVALGMNGVAAEATETNKLSATIRLPSNRPASFSVVISVVITHKTDPVLAAKSQLDDALAIPVEKLRAERDAWWSDYWSKSFLCFQSTDQQADWLTAAYHVELYTLACVNRGVYPASYGGGGLLTDGDTRDGGWMLDWVQEVRFNFSPLYAANRLEMARLLPDSFTAMIPYLRQQTPKVFGFDGIWLPETYMPWGHAETVVLNDDGRKEDWYWYRKDPKKIPYGRFTFFASHTGLLFTSGLEISHHFLTYYRYTEDEKFLRNQAYPFISGVCEFMCNLLRREADGRYHLDPAHALETWWQVRDPADTLDGIRAIFPEFIRLSKRYGLDAELRARCQTVLAALPDHSIGKWHDDGRVDASVDAYAPAGGKHDFPNRINCENPALYRVYPFGLSGIGAPDYERCKRTFEYRTSPLWWGWSMDAIWAARLGLKDEACSLLVEHARRFNTFPFGGWELRHPRPTPREGPTGPPFLDGGGCSATALQEILLQSHGDIIRVAPALSDKWDGVFRLRAEGGFLVSTDLHRGLPRLIEVRSLFGRRCRIANPWKSGCVVQERVRTVKKTKRDVIEFDTVAGEAYLLEPVRKPATAYVIQPVETRFGVTKGYVHHGLPGRDHH